MSFSDGNQTISFNNYLFMKASLRKTNRFLNVLAVRSDPDELLSDAVVVGDLFIQSFVTE